MLFTIMSTDRNGNAVERRTVDLSTPRANGEPRKVGKTDAERAKAALRAYGISGANMHHDKSVFGGVYAVGSRSGKRIWAVPMLDSGEQSATTMEPQVDSDAPYGRKTDGTPKKRPGRKPSNDSQVNNSATVDAPYGLRKDGTPKRRPGRKPAAVQAPTPTVTTKVKRKDAKREISQMIDGTIPMDADRMQFLAAIVAK